MEGLFLNNEMKSSITFDISSGRIKQHDGPLFGQPSLEGASFRSLVGIVISIFASPKLEPKNLSKSAARVLTHLVYISSSFSFPGKMNLSL